VHCASTDAFYSESIQERRRGSIPGNTLHASAQTKSAVRSLVNDEPAVYVTTVGETRSKDRSLLLALVHGQEQDLVFVRSELIPNFPKSVWSMVKGSLTFPSLQSTRWFGSALPSPRERFGEWSFTKGSNRIQEEQPSSITPL
jgi:hypothetical protein